MKRTVVLLGEDRTISQVRARLRSMGEYVEREFFDTLITGDCILGVDASNDVLAEFEESEIATLRRRFRDLSAIVVEHTSEECLRTILHHAVRGLDGVVDDNFGNLFEFSEY